MSGTSVLVRNHDGFEKIRNSLICVHDEFFERDMMIVMDEYISELNTSGKIPSISEMENIVTSINWSISYDMAEFLTDNHEGYIEAFENFAADYMDRYDEKYGYDMDEIRAEFVSETCSDLFNDLYWYSTQEIRDNLRDMLMELYVLYIEDMSYIPALYTSIEYSETHKLYANNAQIIMFEGLYKWQYGEGCMVPTDEGHNCNHLMLRRDHLISERMKLECKEVPM